MKKVMSIAAVALLMAGMTGCACIKGSKCCSDGGACCAEKCPEGCAKPCCAKTE